MQSVSTIGNGFPTWDFVVENGIVPIVEGTVEEAQGATIAVFLLKNSIPQLPDVGIPWSPFLTEDLQFNEVDGEIRTTLTGLGYVDFSPVYDIVNDKLVVNVKKVNIK